MIDLCNELCRCILIGLPVYSYGLPLATGYWINFNDVA